MTITGHAGASAASAVSRRRPGSVARTLEGLPSLRGMSPGEARAAEALGHRLEPAEIVELAIDWAARAGAPPAVVDLAGRDWDDPGLRALWLLALDELGVPEPSPSTARRRIGHYLARRDTVCVARRCPHCGR